MDTERHSIDADILPPSKPIDPSANGEMDEPLNIKDRSNCIENEGGQQPTSLLSNGLYSDVSPQEQQVVSVTPEMLYKLSKKIAQLTKVVM